MGEKICLVQQCVKYKKSLELCISGNALSSTGSTFTRWGKTTCPANSTQVYSGEFHFDPLD